MSDSQQAHSDRAATVSVPRCWLWVWTALLAAPWVLLAVTLGPQWVRQTAQNWRIGKYHREDAIRRCRPGPWGELEYTRIVIEPPEQFIALPFDPDKKVRWVLHGYTPERLGQLWAEAKLGVTEQQTLMASARWENGIGTVVLEPPRELIFNLSPTARARIYQALSEFSENHLQVYPFRFRADQVDEWFRDSDTSERTEKLIRQMLYQRGTAVLFSDLDTLLPMLETARERSRALKTLSRISTLLLKLRVRPNTDLDTVARYWGRGRRSKDIAPLLGSLPKRPEGYTIDAAHLLPSFARRRLYTYPDPDTDPDALRRDCHWTSMNFFNEVPDDRFLSHENTREVIMRDYYPVLGDPLFGDLIFLMRPNAEAVHSCVYVADNIVFTKNGPQPYVPWTLMELSDVRATYSTTDPSIEMRVFRYKHW